MVKKFKVFERANLIGLAVCGMLLSFSGYASESICFGTTKRGKLENGHKLPLWGENFSTYSFALSILGRTYTHSKVRAILLEAYSRLEVKAPGVNFKYAETGFENGGRFRPHKTHQNGLSVDLIVPVIGKKSNKPEKLTTNIFNKWGYGVNFDKNGIYGDKKIDFGSLAKLIVEIDKASKKRGIKIWRVIFAPDLQSKLYQTQSGSYLKKNILIPKKRSWVRHDDHIHIDFNIPCQKL